jgi:hypothetical protein
MIDACCICFCFCFCFSPLWIVEDHEEKKMQLLDWSCHVRLCYSFVDHESYPAIS